MCLFTFTDYLPNPTLQYSVGDAFIVIYVTNFVVNFVIISVKGIILLKSKLKKFLMYLKLRKTISFHIAKMFRQPHTLPQSLTPKSILKASAHDFSRKLSIIKEEEVSIDAGFFDHSERS